MSIPICSTSAASMATGAVRQCLPHYTGANSRALSRDRVRKERRHPQKAWNDKREEDRDRNGRKSQKRRPVQFHAIKDQPILILLYAATCSSLLASIALLCPSPNLLLSALSCIAFSHSSKACVRSYKDRQLNAQSPR